MNTNVSLASLALDLERIALGLHRGSLKMAERFSQEALKRIEEIDMMSVKPYIGSILSALPQKLSSSEKGKNAEDILLYSILIQNYIQHKLV